ncbi:hypothetical protein LUZ63_011666 [Rhynchospora breviuscula]|uniref:Protein CHUP1, chloroplastic-like n=1 Tax=Rhynchospora breviuscula TaxID=2022672 RepID=A0A9Q0CJF4_9POAL|nr:hypothetical protein LUZ63_011666 [Rhynchospora breviuscula]
MREDIMFDNQSKPCKYTQNSSLKPDSKPKFGSSWGSQIVKGFVSDKKCKNRAPLPTLGKKPPPIPCNENLNSNPSSNQANRAAPFMPYQSRVKRSLVGDFPCNVNTSQVHPQGYDSNLLRSPASREIFAELDHLREQLRESKERELALKCEILQLKENPRAAELERENDAKTTEIEKLKSVINLLETEKSGLREEISNLNLIVEREGNVCNVNGENIGAELKNLEVEVLELKRVNKELQFEKRNLAMKLTSAESKLEGVAKEVESGILAKIQAEASLLRHKNANLSKQIEGLQMSRLTEVEELAYLRWINSCLRHELSNSDKNSSQTLDMDQETTNPRSDETKSECNEAFKGENFRSPSLETIIHEEWRKTLNEQSPTRRHSISGPHDSRSEETRTYSDVVNKRRQSDNFITAHKEICNKERSPIQTSFENFNFGFSVPQVSRLPSNKDEMCIEKRAVRVPNPPPRPSSDCSSGLGCSISNGSNGSDSKKPPPPPPPPGSGSSISNGSHGSDLKRLPPPPPPPPPLPKFSNKSAGIMQRAPQVAELYHSLMKRDSRRDSCGGAICGSSGDDCANVRSSMIGEIENRSSHLLAIKADVETQGEFVKSLIKEVNNAAYQDIEDVVAFVKWLDDELCFLVDERAVLKHFDWPEKKADSLREAAFGYCDLKKLETEVSNYEDDPRLPRDVALKKMVSLSEKMEKTIYNLLRTRDAMVRQCKQYSIPTDWILDKGLISKIKFASVKLAKKYMKRVANELQVMGALNKDPALEYMLLQGVRFAFRIHQFAGGFDAETMDAFEELRNLVHVRNKAS